MKIGLALSGGGVRGFFHAGLLHAFRERDMQVDVISGTSAGAITGALYAANKNLKEVTDRFPKRMRYLFFEPTLLIKSKFNPTSILKEYLQLYLDGLVFDDMAVPLNINAVNLSSGDTEIFDEGTVLDAVMAAAAIPGVFNFFHENGNIYVDGGLTMNLPAATIRDKCDFLIGVNLLPFKERSYTKLPSRRHLIQRSVDIFHRHNNQQQVDLCDVVISPKALGNYPTFDTTNKNELFDLGYETGMAFTPAI